MKMSVQNAWGKYFKTWLACFKGRGNVKNVGMIVGYLDWLYRNAV